MPRLSKLRPKTARDPIAFLLWGWVIVLCWAVVPIGSYRTWATALVQVPTFALLAWWTVLYAQGKVEVSEAFRAARPALILYAIWLAYHLLYLVPLPVSVIAVLSPEAARMHALTEGMSDTTWRTLSLSPHDALINWIRSVLYGGAFCLTLLLLNSRERVRQFCVALVVFALCISTYAILMHLLAVSHTWFGRPLSHGIRAIGTFWNPNHLAGYLELTLAIGIGLLIGDLEDRRAETWRQLLRNTLEWIFSPKMRLRLLLCVLVIALVSTRSRMGNTAFFAALMLTGVIGIILSKHATRGTVVLLTSLLVIDIFIVGSWFGVEQLAQRIESTTLTKEAAIAAGTSQESLQARLDPTDAALAIVKDYPVFGTGPGSWYASFARYRPPEIIGFYNFAHNDYVQFAVETGLLGLAMMGIFVLMCFIAALVAQYQRRDPLMRGISFASIMGTIALMIHSAVDFNLQIPSNAMLFMVVLSLGWISLYMGRRDRTPRRSDASPNQAMQAHAADEASTERGRTS